MPDVATPSAAFKEMDEEWQLVDDLLGGTETMREAAERWLPRNEQESATAYQMRLGRSFLFPGFQHTIDTFTGKVFREDIDVSRVNARLAELFKDIDLQGNDLDAFCTAWFRQGLSHGLSYVLVDHPAQPEGRTLAEEREAGVRPYWVHYSPRQIIGWRSETVGGAEVLTRVRIREVVQEYDDEWNDDGGVDQIRVLERGKYTLYRRNKNEWFVYQDGTTSIDFIPLVPFYAKRTGFMTASPPLMELAWKNVEHWQSASEQRNILHVARVPILFGRGFRRDDGGDSALGGPGQDVVIGANQMLIEESETADLKWVEHSGQCIAAGKDDLETIKQEMAALGSEILMSRPGSPTATQDAIEAAQSDSNLVRIVKNFQAAVNTALRYTGAWIKQTDVGEVTMTTQLTVMPTDVPQTGAQPGATPQPRPAA
ncbi:MAG TPA: DUF4055 domain-containing protein [Alphaproteobacteria bacterium]